MRTFVAGVATILCLTLPGSAHGSDGEPTGISVVKVSIASKGTASVRLRCAADRACRATYVPVVAKKACPRCELYGSPVRIPAHRTQDLPLVYPHYVRNGRIPRGVLARWGSRRRAFVVVHRGGSTKPQSKTVPIRHLGRMPVLSPASYRGAYAGTTKQGTPVSMTITRNGYRLKNFRAEGQARCKSEEPSRPYDGPATRHVNAGARSVRWMRAFDPAASRTQRLLEAPRNFPVDPDSGSVSFEFRIERRNPSADLEYALAGTREVRVGASLSGTRLRGWVTIEEFRGAGVYCTMKSRFSARRR